MSERIQQSNNTSKLKEATPVVSSAAEDLEAATTAHPNSSSISPPQFSHTEMMSVQDQDYRREIHAGPSSKSEDAPHVLSEQGGEGTNDQDQDQGQLTVQNRPVNRTAPGISSAARKTSLSEERNEQEDITFTVPLPPQDAKGSKPGLPSAKTRLTPEEFRNLLGMPEWKPLNRGAPGGRNYNYEELYDEDEPGEATGPSARFFKVFNDEAELFDKGMVRSHTGTLDALLVLAALFSAIVTAFIIETAKALEPDQALITNDLIEFQIRLSLANGNVTEMASLAKEHSAYNREVSSHSSSDVWINGLFLASLVLSLSTALLSVLAKQWLQAYDSSISGNPREQALTRQLRFRGVEKWKMEEIIGALPLILHASLAVFFAGLFVWLRKVSSTLSWIIVAFAGPTLVFYLASLLLPAIDINCPYRIPLLYRPMRLLVLVFRRIFQRPFQRPFQKLFQRLFPPPSPLPPGQPIKLPVKPLFRRLFHFIFQQVPFWYWNGRQYQFGRYSTCPRFNEDGNPIGCGPIYSKIAVAWNYLTQSTTASTSLREAELASIRNPEVQRCFVQDSIVWLHNMSSNSTVRLISAQALAGKHCDLSFTSTEWGPVFAHPWPFSFAQAVIASEGLMKTALQGLFAGSDIHPYDKERYQECSPIARAIFNMRHIAPQVSGLVKDTLLKAVETGRTNHVDFILRFHQVEEADMKFWSQEEQGVQEVLDRSSQNFPQLLRLASQRGHYAVAKLLLENGADVNLANGFNQTALQAASFAGHLPVVKLLVEKGANVNIAGRPWGAPLQAASIQGHLAVIEFLLEHGADVNIPWKDYGTALQAASREGRFPVVKLLLERGADVNMICSPEGTGLQAASTRGHISVVQLLLEYRADVNMTSGYYGTALQAASHQGHLSVVKLLMKNEADVNITGGRYGTALQAASSRGHILVAQLLVENRADVNITAGCHGTALQAASLEGHRPVVQLLVENGADVNTIGGYDGTALQAGSKRGDLPVVQLLVEHGADVNITGGEYGTALQAASYKGHLPVVQLLVENGADVNIIGGRCGTAVQAASLEGHLPVVQLLVENGADVNIIGGEDGTALRAASLEGHLPVVDYLKAHGATH